MEWVAVGLGSGLLAQWQMIVLSLLFDFEDVLPHFKHKCSAFGFCVDTQFLCFIEIILGVPLISICSLSMMRVCLHDGHSMHFGSNSSNLRNSSMAYFSLIEKHMIRLW